MKGSETIPQGSTLRRCIIDAREAPRTLTLLDLFEVIGAGDKIVHPSLKKGDQCNQLVASSNLARRASQEHVELKRSSEGSPRNAGAAFLSTSPP